MGRRLDELLENGGELRVRRLEHFEGELRFQATLKGAVSASASAYGETVDAALRNIGAASGVSDSADLLRLLAVVEHVDDERAANRRGRYGDGGVVGRAFSALMAALGDFEEPEQAILDHYRSELEAAVGKAPARA